MIKKAFINWLDERIQPWHLHYRVVEIKRFRELTSEIETLYIIQGRIKFTPFWFKVGNREYSYFCKAYTEMKTLRGIPKTEFRPIPESECILLLMGDEDE